MPWGEQRKQKIVFAEAASSLPEREVAAPWARDNCQSHRQCFHKIDPTKPTPSPVTACHAICSSRSIQITRGAAAASERHGPATTTKGEMAKRIRRLIGPLQFLLDPEQFAR